MNSRNILIDIALHNGSNNKHCNLVGYAYIDSGFLAGKIHSKNDDLSESEYLLLSGFTFTGCPIAARTNIKDANPWIWTNGSYEASRSMQGKGFNVLSSISAKGSANEIKMNLAVTIEGVLPEFTTVGRAFQEKIKQKEIGNLEGYFEMDFIDKKGNLVRTHSSTQYKLDVDRAIDPVWRNITILDSASSNYMLQVEQIDLFSDEIVAAKDLEGKRNVSSFFTTN